MELEGVGENRQRPRGGGGEEEEAEEKPAEEARILLHSFAKCIKTREIIFR